MRFQKNFLEISERRYRSTFANTTIGTDDAIQEFLKKLASRSDLGTKVSSKMFAKAISDAHLLLPSPKSIKPK